MTREAFVKAFQRDLATKYPHGYQGKWHRFVFHFSDISNVTSILESGKLYSRNKATALGVMHNDNASDDVIGNTGLDAKNFVRFYFGTGTPTQFHNEGFKPKNKIKNNAHCPLPIFLLFDFVKVLSREDCLFSSGNIAASGVDIYRDITELHKLEFEYIYHRGVIPDTLNMRHVVYCRHAEVLVPDELDIENYLKFIYVRSQAERETLLYILSEEIKNALQHKVLIGTNGLFEPDRFYVENVIFMDGRIIINFSKSTTDKYRIQVKVTNNDTKKIWEHDADNISLEDKRLTIKLNEQFIGTHMELILKIDENLAYANMLIDYDNFIF